MSRADALADAKGAAAFGAAVGFLLAAASFLPSLRSLPLDASDIVGMLQLGALLGVPAGAGTLFGIVLGRFSARFGTLPVATVLLLFNVTSVLYSAWRGGEPITRRAIFEGCAWGLAMGAFAAVAGRLVKAQRARG